jgi:hypothetical protein
MHSSIPEPQSADIDALPLPRMKFRSPQIPIVLFIKNEEIKAEMVFFEEPI